MTSRSRRIDDDDGDNGDNGNDDANGGGERSERVKLIVDWFSVKGALLDLPKQNVS